MCDPRLEIIISKFVMGDIYSGSQGLSTCVTHDQTDLDPDPIPLTHPEMGEWDRGVVQNMKPCKVIDSAFLLHSIPEKTG